MGQLALPDEAGGGVTPHVEIVVGLAPRRIKEGVVTIDQLPFRITGGFGKGAADLQKTAGCIGAAGENVGVDQGKVFGEGTVLLLDFLHQPGRKDGNDIRKGQGEKKDDENDEYRRLSALRLQRVDPVSFGLHEQDCAVPR